MGTNFLFSILGGSYDDTGEFNPEDGSTVWISIKHFEKTARPLGSTKEDIEKIVLQSGLYKRPD